MFDLENAITDWKQSLVTCESLSPDNIAELETHLRESVSMLATGSLNEEEAFLIARRRVGPVDTLGSEYAKENPRAVWAGRFKWMCLGHLHFLALSQISSLFIWVVWQSLSIRPDLSVSFALIGQVGSMLCFASFLAIGILLTMRKALLVDRMSKRFRRFPNSVLFSVPVAVFAMPQLIGLIWAYTQGHDVPFESLVAVGYTLISPILLVMVAYLLQRREQVAETV